MAFKVEFSEQGSRDLDVIIGYISDDLSSPQAAQKFFNAVNEKLIKLQDSPYLYPLYHDDKLAKEGFRFITLGNYLMFYLVDDDTSVVSIVRIIYGRRDIPAVFETGE